MRHNTSTPSLQGIVILHIALAVGVLVFGGFCVYVTQPGEISDFSVLVIVGLAAAAGAVGAATVVPPMVANGHIQSLARSQADDEAPDRDSLLSVYHTAAITGASILDGAAFLNLTAYLFDANPISLGVGAALAIAILIRIPSQHSLETWLDDKRRDIQRYRTGL